MVGSIGNRNKKTFNHWVRSCAFELSGIPTTTHLNLLSLGAYNILLDMDWLYLHKTKVNFYEKEIECLDDVGEKNVLWGKQNKTSMRLITKMQAKCKC